MRCDSPTFSNCQRSVMVVIEYGMTGIPVCNRHLAPTIRWCMETRQTITVVSPEFWEITSEWKENQERSLSNEQTR
jgi:hypothetical protein